MPKLYLQLLKLFAIICKKSLTYSKVSCTVIVSMKAQTTHLFYKTGLANTYACVSVKENSFNTYMVNPVMFTCSCPSAKYQRGACKHMGAIEALLLEAPDHIGTPEDFATTVTAFRQLKALVD